MLWELCTHKSGRCRSFLPFLTYFCNFFVRSHWILDNPTSPRPFWTHSFLPQKASVLAGGTTILIPLRWSLARASSFHDIHTTVVFGDEGPSVTAPSTRQGPAILTNLSQSGTRLSSKPLECLFCTWTINEEQNQRMHEKIKFQLACLTRYSEVASWRADTWISHT